MTPATKQKARKTRKPLAADATPKRESLVIPDEIVQLGVDATERYILWCVEHGGPPETEMERSLAAWFARRRGFGTSNTDRAFLEGRANGAQFERCPVVGDAYARVYRKLMGRDPPKNSVYISQLAAHSGDPRAWVSDIGDLKRRMKEMGKGAEELGVPAAEVLPPKKKELSERIINRHLQNEFRKPGYKFEGGRVTRGGRPVDVQQMRERIIDKHGYRPEQVSETTAVKRPTRFKKRK